MLGFGAIGQFAIGEGPIATSVALGEDSWHQTWSQPVRQKIAPALAIALIVSGLFAPVITTFPEKVSEDKWHQPWSEPVRFKPRLQETLQQAYFATDREPIVTFAYYRALSEPVRVQPRLPEGEQHFFEMQLTPSPFVASGWFNWLSEPVRVKPRLPEGEQQFLSYSESAQFPETVSEDRWHQPWSEPQAFLVKRGLVYYEQPYFQMQPMPSPFVASGWFNWLSDPVRQPVGTYAWRQPFFYPDAKPSVSFSWFNKLNEPVKYPDGRPARLEARFQHYLEFSEFFFRETVTEDRWHQPWSEPVRFKPDIGVSRQPFLLAPTPYVITITFTITETPDIFAASVAEYNTQGGVNVSISEIAPIYANVSIISIPQA